MKNHLKHMVIAGVGVFALLLIFGVDVGKALPWAALLACPLMMVAMMWTMNRGQGGHGGHGNARDQGNTVQPSDTAPEHQHH